jgi:hypothetical protein
MELYNPKDCWHRPYFIITESWVYINRACALTEKDYEQMCDRKWVNPIYPTNLQSLSKEKSIPVIPMEKPKKPKPRKKIIPRPPKQPKDYLKVDNVYDRIRKRREELWITI